MLAYLENPTTVFDAHKGTGISFDPKTHQLRQPLYLVKIDAEANLGATPAGRLAAAKLVAELPAPDGSE